MCQISRSYSPKILCFFAFLGGRREGKTRNLSCWCIMTTFRVEFGYGQLLIFLILTQFSHRGMGEIWYVLTFSIRCVEEMDWNLACWCILIAVRTVWILVTACWFSQYWCSKTYQMNSPVCLEDYKYLLRHIWQLIFNIFATSNTDLVFFTKYI